jgi:hypothetical protein
VRLEKWTIDLILDTIDTMVCRYFDIHIRNGQVCDVVTAKERTVIYSCPRLKVCFQRWAFEA